MSTPKKARRTQLSPAEWAEFWRLREIFEDARARGDIDARADAADELANYLMAIICAPEGEA